MPIGSQQWMYASGEDYNIPYSCRFNAADSARLTRTTAGTPTNSKKATISFWWKNSEADGGGSGSDRVFFGAGEAGYLYYRSDNTIAAYGTGVDYDFRTTAMFRDPSAWYHIVWAFDTTQGTDTNRVKLYVNNEQVTAWNAENYPSQNIDLEFNETSKSLYIGGGFAGYLHAGLAEFHFIDGTAYAPSDFGEAGDYGEWKAKKVSGLTYGNNGFYLDFADAADLGNDVSGEGNDWTENNITAADQMLDTPTNNFATLNAIWKDSSVNLQEGNLRHNRTSNMNRPALSTLGMGTGKWYFEAWDSYTTGNQIGITWEGTDVETYVHEAGTQAYTWNNAGSTYANGVYAGGGSAGSVASGNNIRMVAYDGATGKLWGGANGTWGSSGDPAAGTNESMTVPVAYRDKMHGIVATENSSTAQGIIANFGQDSSFAGNKTAQGNQDDNEIGDFYYDVPAGFMALCTSNMTAPDVTPSEHFNTVLYTGNGTTGQSITGVGFQPDFLWAKARASTTGSSHRLFDAVRGVSKQLRSNVNSAEGTDTELTSFDSDGFTIDDDGDGSLNDNNIAYVAWNWKAGNATLGTGDFTQGSLASTCSRNVDAGFSIVSYTGNETISTVGHGLSKAPELLIVKHREAATNWITLCTAGTDVVGYLNLTTAFGTSNLPYFFGNSGGGVYTAPTATVFTIGGAGETQINDDTETFIAYCFHSVDGFSKVGSYTGNGNADGTFIYTGFRPAFVIIKPSSRGGHWMMANSESNPYNVVDKVIFANDSAEEYTDPAADCKKDFFSNGFKIRTTDDNTNESDSTYIYLAFAETPFKYSNAR